MKKTLNTLVILPFEENFKMNSHTGLDYIIENREFTKKLASGEKWSLGDQRNTSIIEVTSSLEMIVGKDRN